jgi:hypothetical protein
VSYFFAQIDTSKSENRVQTASSITNSCLKQPRMHCFHHTHTVVSCASSQA